MFWTLLKLAIAAVVVVNLWQAFSKGEGRRFVRWAAVGLAGLLAVIVL